MVTRGFLEMIQQRNLAIEGDYGKEEIMKYSNASNAVYGLGFIGAAVYYLLHTHSILDGVVGLLKAVVWPSFLIYRLLEFLKM